MGESGGNTCTGGKPPFQSLAPTAEDLDTPPEFEKSAHPDKSEKALEDNLVVGKLPPFEDSDTGV